MGSQGGTTYATFALYLCSMDKAIAIKAMYGYTGLRVKRAKRWLDGSKMTRSGFYKFRGQMLVFFVSMKQTLSTSGHSMYSITTVRITHYDLGLGKTTLTEPWIGGNGCDGLLAGKVVCQEQKPDGSLISERARWHVAETLWPLGVFWVLLVFDYLTRLLHVLL